MSYTPWETIEVVANHDTDFTCNKCGEVFAFVALFEYPDSEEGLRKAFPYWCPRCDAPPAGTRK